MQRALAHFFHEVLCSQNLFPLYFPLQPERFFVLIFTKKQNIPIIFVYIQRWRDFMSEIQRAQFPTFSLQAAKDFTQTKFVGRCVNTLCHYYQVVGAKAQVEKICRYYQDHMPDIQEIPSSYYRYFCKYSILAKIARMNYAKMYTKLHNFIEQKLPTTKQQLDSATLVSAGGLLYSSLVGSYVGGAFHLACGALCFFNSHSLTSLNGSISRLQTRNKELCDLVSDRKNMEACFERANAQNKELSNQLTTVLAEIAALNTLKNTLESTVSTEAELRALLCDLSLKFSQAQEISAQIAQSLQDKEVSTQLQSLIEVFKTGTKEQTTLLMNILNNLNTVGKDVKDIKNSIISPKDPVANNNSKL
jgi:hypothetical protein